MVDLATVDIKTELVGPEQLAWQVALEADVEPSVAAAAVQTLSALVHEGLQHKASRGVAGIGSIQPTTRERTTTDYAVAKELGQHQAQ